MTRVCFRFGELLWLSGIKKVWDTVEDRAVCIQTQAQIAGGQGQAVCESRTARSSMYSAQGRALGGRQ